LLNEDQLNPRGNTMSNGKVFLIGPVVGLARQVKQAGLRRRIA